MASIPSLLDLCLFTVSKNLDGCKLNVLPDHIRQRLGLLFKNEASFQKQLEDLNFYHCFSLSDDELKPISFLTNLKYLNLTRCDNLTGYALSHIAHCVNLTHLCVNHCTKISVGFCFLPPLKKLAVLDAAFCEIQDPVISYLASLPSLSSLNLMCNRLSDEGCASLSAATNLTKLVLSMNPLITDKTLEVLSGLSKLSSLNLNFCKLLSSEGIDRLSAALPHLLQLDIVGCDRAFAEGKVRPLILLAEDSKVQARMISLVLKRYNFDVEVATNGEMALEMFRSNPKYDLILMDVLMPLMDGVSCVKEIRGWETQHSLRRTPIIVQTADTRESQRTICLEAGASEVLCKPIDKTCISLAKELMETS